MEKDTDSWICSSCLSLPTLLVRMILGPNGIKLETRIMGRDGPQQILRGSILTQSDLAFLPRGCGYANPSSSLPPSPVGSGHDASA